MCRIRFAPKPWMVLAAVLAGGCAPAELSYERSLAEVPASAAHAVHSERLAQLMRSLERLTFERLPQAMDAGTEVERRAALVAEVARALAASAEQIPQALSATDLEPREREEFVRLADTLAREASVIADDATALSPSQLAARAREIEASCDRCHQRFRLPIQPDG